MQKGFQLFVQNSHSARRSSLPCGNLKMEKMMSRFAAPRGAEEPAEPPEFDEPKFPAEEARMEQVMGEIEKDMEYVDENNPKHLAIS